LSFIGPNLLNSGSTNTGAAQITNTISGMVASALYSHQRRGVLRISRYGTHSTSGVKTSPSASAFSESPIHLPKVWFDSPYRCPRTNSE